MINIIGKVLPFCRGFNTINTYRFSFLSDYFTKKSLKNQQSEFKKQMQYLANKPIFTLMDYKQRVDDQLNKSKGKFRSKINNDAQQNQKQLQIEKKILGSLFENQLNMQTSIKFQQKQQIALVTQMPIQTVSKTLGKFDEYKKMHKVLRSLKLNNEPLPQSYQQFQQIYLNSSVARSSKQMRYQKYKKYSRIQRNRYTKQNFNHGYFFN